MAKVVGVSFEDNCRIYLFNSLNFQLSKGDKVIVDTARGAEIATVVRPTHDINDEDLTMDLKEVIRIASFKDIKYYEENKKLAADAFKVFVEKAKAFNLEMKPLYAEYTIDRTKITFYYVAEDRVDFRELLKVLNPMFKSRVELHQIGPREGARVIGGIGPCGMEICCKRHLTNFVNVTMKMAKEQDMNINTSKISGTCGKLMCCIAFENELYKQMKAEFPKVGTIVTTPNCEKCKIEAIDYFKKLIKVKEKIDGPFVTYNKDDIKLYQEAPVSVEEEPQTVEEVVVNTEKEIVEMTEEVVKVEDAKPKNNKKPFIRRPKRKKKY